MIRTTDRGKCATAEANSNRISATGRVVTAL
jgi:hypothetical protein